MDYFASIKDVAGDYDGFTHQMLQREAYETIYGITDLGDSNQPLGLVRYTNADTLGDLGSVAELIHEYANNEIKDKFGLSITDYFEVPISTARLLVSIARTQKDDTKTMVEQAERNAKNNYNKK